MKVPTARMIETREIETAPSLVFDCSVGGDASAPLVLYRARGERAAIGPTRVPTLFIWGEADDTVGRIAAEGTAEFICADYRFAPLPGVGHYAADRRPVLVNELLLDHLVSHSV